MTSSAPTQEEIEVLLDGPALPPPPNVVPNFDNPPHRNGIGYGLLSAMLAIVTFPMICRLYVKNLKARKFRLADALGIASYILFVVYLASVYQVLQFPGFYVHQWDVRVRDMSRILYPFNIASNTYSAMIGTTKAAILLEWLQVFNPMGHRNSFFWMCHIMLWINILFYGASAIAINLACIPRERIWDKTITDGHCFNEIDLYLAGTIVNLISDVAIFAVPQKVIWSLHMTVQKKVRVSCIFAIGLLCIGIACARIASTAHSQSEIDSVYHLPRLAFLATAEMVCALLVFCVPAVPQALTSVRTLPIVSQISLLLKSRGSTRNEASWASCNGRFWQRNSNSKSSADADLESGEYRLRPLDHPTSHDAKDIVRTTKFETSESYNTTNAASNKASSAHPWT